MAKCESCHNCVYSRWNPGQWMASLSSGFPVRPTCANQPDSPGRWEECPLGCVCRNFRARPPTPQGETVKTIPVGDGLYAYVDAADFEWLSQWTWYLSSGYAARSEKGKTVYMHREIMKPPKGKIVDHKNRNKLDDTRDNLRIGTHRDNACNRGKRRGTASRFIGVGYRKRQKKWYAVLFCEGRNRHLAYFDDEIEAAQAHDYAAVERFGGSRRLNFPEEWPPERIREVHAKRSARKNRKRSTARVSRGRRRVGDRKNHGRDARATKRRPVRKAKRKR